MFIAAARSYHLIVASLAVTFWFVCCAVSCGIGSKGSGRGQRRRAKRVFGSASIVIIIIIACLLKNIPFKVLLFVQLGMVWSEREREQSFTQHQGAIYLRIFVALDNNFLTNPMDAYLKAKFLMQVFWHSVFLLHWCMLANVPMNRIATIVPWPIL